MPTGLFRSTNSFRHENVLAISIQVTIRLPVGEYNELQLLIMILTTRTICSALPGSTKIVLSTFSCIAAQAVNENKETTFEMRFKETLGPCCKSYLK